MKINKRTKHESTGDQEMKVWWMGYSPLWWGCCIKGSTCFCRHCACAVKRLEDMGVRGPPGLPGGMVCWWLSGVVDCLPLMRLGAALVMSRATTSSTWDSKRDIAMMSCTSWKLLPWSEQPFHCSTSSPRPATCDFHVIAKGWRGFSYGRKLEGSTLPMDSRMLD